MTRILAVETSCDETAAAVVVDGRHIVANVVATQIELHRRFGGVFPEVASRQHVLAIHPVVREALATAGMTTLNSLDAIAVTHGPGLAGSLLVGVNTAKGMSFTSGVPLMAINHLEGHVYSNWLETDTADDAAGTSGVPSNRFPVLVLIVSGGHTELVLMEEHCRYHHLGGTLDDAAGEAFDKVARLLKLGFPGGPAIQQAAALGQTGHYHLPRPLSRHSQHRFDFSFSGLKTAVLNLTRRLQAEGVDPATAPTVNDIAAAFQAAVVDVLVERCVDAAQAFAVGQVCICGGVSANQHLRAAMATRMAELGIPLHIPPLFLCTDNAAMIAAAAHHRLRHGSHPFANLDLDVHATLPLAPPP